MLRYVKYFFYFLLLLSLSYAQKAKKALPSTQQNYANIILGTPQQGSLKNKYTTIQFFLDDPDFGAGVKDEVVQSFPKKPHKVSPKIKYDYDYISWGVGEKAQKTSLENLSRGEQMLIQIFLDEHNFGPGVLDGAIGGFTKKAIAAYYDSIGFPDHDDYNLVLERALAHKSNPFITITVPDMGKDFTNPNLPHKYSLMAKETKAKYRYYHEFIIERYHTSEKALIRLNSKSQVHSLAPGQQITVPNIVPFEIEHMNTSSNKSDPNLADNYAIVDTSEKTLHIYRAQNGADPLLLAFFPITPGKEDQIRYGEWKVKNSVPNPVWRYDPLVLKGKGRSKNKDIYNVPGGPNNPVGVLWNGLSAPSVGIHGTNQPETIGRTRSSGCIRMSNWDVVKFPNFIRPGCKVIIK